MAWPLLALAAALNPIIAAEDIATFRIRFGLTDKAPTSWDGSVRVSGGEIVSLKSWRPRAADQIDGLTSWKLATTPGRKFQYRNWEPEPSTPVPDYLDIPGLILGVRAPGDATVSIETAQGNLSFRLSDVPAGRRKQFFSGGVTIERAATGMPVSQRDFESGSPTIVAEEDGAYRVAWVGFRDGANHVFVRRFDGSTWGETQELTTGPSDAYLVRLASDGKGGLWAVWSNQVDDNFDLWGRHLNGRRWQPAVRLTTAARPDIHHVLSTDSNGNIWLVWQGFRDSHSDILARRWDGSSWSEEERVSTSSADDWNPAVAADGSGAIWVAWETYDRGDYNILMRRRDADGWSDIVPVADTPRYEAYPSLVCDNQDRVWAAWNESDMQWGKDTGFLVRRPATQLYQSRWMSVAVYDNGKWREPAADLEESLPGDLRSFNDFPRLQSDEDGRVWVLFRHRLLRQRDVPETAGAHRASWESYATAYDGQRWSTPLPLPVSQGRSDAAFEFARDSHGGLLAAWATDHRDYDEFLFEHGEVLAARLPELTARLPDLPDPAQPLDLRTRVKNELRIFEGHPNEADDIARIRAYKIESGGKTYRIYRGDTHRHTEYSHDGNNDGSLNDTYRYSLNAADLDYLGLSEHHNNGGPNIDYINWLLQQRVDVFTVAGRFVPLYGYERGLGYPNGHRNVMFAERGNPTFPNQPGESEAKVGAKALFAYLKKYNGISIPHTSATGMGTDWRDNDPEVETLVEIFQGDRVSAEYEGAPKAATASDVTSQAGGFRPAGYVWNAWAKGYKLGVQASSDHLSTHYSYSCTIAEEFTRTGLLDAMRQRHNYGATDNIVLDYRLQTDGREYLQGDIVRSSSGEFKLWVNIIGTAPIRQVDIIRNNEFVHTLQNQESELSFTFVDSDTRAGETYYYVRVLQANEQIAWSSPIWITTQ